MAEFIINSKTYGAFIILLDEVDLQRIKQVGGKWGVCKMRESFYVQKRFSDGKVRQLHRYILDAKKGEYVDHINRDTLDNRRENLRICTNAANIRNGKKRVNNVSGYQGVHFDKSRGKWQAYIKVRYKRIFLGRYDSFEKAVAARKTAEKKYWNA